MSFAWESIVVLAIVAAAAVYVTRAAWQAVARRKTAACGACGTCPSGRSGEGQVVVGIERLSTPTASSGDANSSLPRSPKQ